MSEPPNVARWTASALRARCQSLPVVDLTDRPARLIAQGEALRAVSGTAARDRRSTHGAGVPLAALLLLLFTMTTPLVAAEYAPGQRDSGKIYRLCGTGEAAGNQIRIAHKLATSNVIPSASYLMNTGNCAFSNAYFEVYEFLSSYSGYLGWAIELDESSSYFCPIELSGLGESMLFPCRWVREKSEWYSVKVIGGDGKFFKDADGKDLFYTLEVYPSKIPDLRKY